MKLNKWFQANRKRGIALIVVVGALALTTVLLIAMFSVTESEYRSTQSYVAAQSAKQLADIAVSVVQAQIQDAQIGPNSAQWNPNSRTTHATQPGAVTVFNPNGTFLRAHKLYSSSNMIATSLANLIRGKDNAGSELVPHNWNSKDNLIYRARFVDLNEPVVRAPLNADKKETEPAVYFPIIDPRAAYNFRGGQSRAGFEPVYASNQYATNTSKVEGFSYVAKAGASGPSTSLKETYTGWASGAATFDGTLTPEDVASPSLLRLPMPVEWMYILKDGTFGVLDGTGHFVKAPGGSEATAENPIVGRVAFWTDDESCKININTATEPTFSNSPFYFHDRDRLWAHYPAATGEYQRYPGHPATVALSAVLYPYHRLDAYNPEPGMTKAQIVSLKNQIYDLAPKVGPGGSQAGTVPFVVDEVNGFGDSAMASLVDLNTALNERLYTSMDEMLFKDGVYTAAGRVASSITSPTGEKIFDHDTLERTRFFLTANSRSPEFTNHGLPRICMWPVADEVAGVDHRTNFDNMIALCATIKNVSGGTGGNTGNGSYFFRRLDPHHSTADVTGGGGKVYDGRHVNFRIDNSTTLTRNSKLLSYIESQLSRIQFPSSGAGTATNFAAKYGTDNVRQLAVEIFDYIRCTNLYDGVQARWNNGDLTGVTQSSGGNFAQRYDAADDRAPYRFTYTNQRNSPSWTDDENKSHFNKADQAKSSAATAVLPGHGTVTPAAWKNGGQVYMGFGRFFTLSEIGLHLICTGDGGHDPVNDTYEVGSKDSNRPGWDGFGINSGGGSAVRADQHYNAQPETGNYKPLKNSDVSILNNCNLNPDKPAQWWSNFPPLLGNPEQWVHPKTKKSILTDYYGCNTKKEADPSSNAKHPSYHPGCYPENWNLTLAYNTPLEPDVGGVGGEKRIQANLDIETFCAMSGWTKFYPEFTIVLDGDYISGIELASGSGPKKKLYQTTGDIALKSNNNHYEVAGTHSLGGHASPAALQSGRASTSFGVDGDGLPTKPIPDPEYDLSPSKPRDGLNNYALASNFLTVRRDQPVKVTFPKTALKIRIYDSHDWQNRDPVQVISVRFNDVTAPTPKLASPSGKVNNFRVFISGTSQTYSRSYQGPHWWVYNSLGCIGRMKGKPSPAWTEGNGSFWQEQPQDILEENIKQETRGRLQNGVAVMAKPPQGATGRGFDLAEFANNGVNPSATGSATSLPFEIRDNTTRVDMDCDVVRTMVPAVGDYRMIAARYDVPENMWVPHPMWRAQSGLDPLEQFRTIHSYTAQYGTAEPGYKLGVNPNSKYTPGNAPFGLEYNPKLTLVSSAYKDPTGSGDTPQHFDRQPDLPGQEGYAWASNSFGDFDTTISSGREGPFVNKPDEGNFYAGDDTRNINGQNIKKFYRSAYFHTNNSSGLEQTDDWRNGVYMTPNRMVSSPVMFGSLPTGIWNTGGSVPVQYSSIFGGNFGSETGISADTYPARPWQTLLFRPHTVTLTTGTVIGSKGVHPGMLNPMDHYVLDLFFMPVVEPYAISEPLSVAGRININYQILPFTNIRRATGMHALMKGEFMTSVPGIVSVKGNRSGVVALKGIKPTDSFSSSLWDQFINEKAQVQGDSSDGIYCHRPINIEETLAQFDERFKMDGGVFFASQGPFRSASQICELYMIPSMGEGENAASASSPAALKGLTAGSRKAVMDNFWAANPATGDNIREKIYANLYPRTTTRSNTFRVHVRAQVLKKARSSDPTIFHPDKDAVLSEYRGSTVLERYIDPNDTNKDYQIPDYASIPNPFSVKPLDLFYKFRALESKRFNP